MKWDTERRGEWMKKGDMAKRELVVMLGRGPGAAPSLHWEGIRVQGFGVVSNAPLLALPTLF